MARQQGQNHATIELPGYGEATADFNREFVPMNVDRMLSQTHHDPSIADLVDIDKQEIPVLGYGLVGHDLVQNPSVLLLVYPQLIVRYQHCCWLIRKFSRSLFMPYLRFPSEGIPPDTPGKPGLIPASWSRLK